jgi:hypothetical protein
MGPVALGRKKQDTHRQPTGGTQGCGDSLGRGKLPATEAFSARLFGCHSSWPRRSPDPARSGTYARCMAPHPNVIGRLAKTGWPKAVTVLCERGVRGRAREFLSPEFPAVNDPKQN